MFELATVWHGFGGDASSSLSAGTHPNASAFGKHGLARLQRLKTVAVSWPRQNAPVSGCGVTGKQRRLQFYKIHAMDQQQHLASNWVGQQPAVLADQFATLLSEAAHRSPYENNEPEEGQFPGMGGMLAGGFAQPGGQGMLPLMGSSPQGIHAHCAPVHHARRP